METLVHGKFLSILLCYVFAPFVLRLRIPVRMNEFMSTNIMKLAPQSRQEVVVVVGQYG